MVNDQYKIKRSFIPRNIGDFIKKINRNFTSKLGKIEFVIISKWPEITGSYFSQYSEPKNITRIPISENDLGEPVYKSCLNVNVSSAAALEFQHYKNTILEKINSYFGYKAIVDIKIHQKLDLYSSIKVKNKINTIELTYDEKNVIESKVENMSNNNLKESLINLGQTISKEEKNAK